MAFPTTSPPSLSNWQMYFNGLTLGNSTPYALYNVQGLDLPAIRSGDVPRPREQGEWIGLDLMAGRLITIVGDMISNGTSIESSAQNLGGAFIPGGTTELPLWFQWANLPILAAMCRTRKNVTPIDLGFSVNALASMNLQLFATDPRLYAASQSSSCGVGTALGGGVFPATFPYSFTHGSVAGSIAANNAGNFETRPLLTLTGPLTNPTVYNATTGWQLTLTNPNQVGFTVQSGDTVTIDTDTHAVLYYVGGAGTPAPIRAWIVAGSTWPSTPNGVAGLAPGNNTVQLTSTGTSDTGSLTCEWSSAYLF